jgi:hypothetical protein
VGLPAEHAERLLAYGAFLRRLRITSSAIGRDGRQAASTTSQPPRNSTQQPHLSPARHRGHRRRPRRPADHPQGGKGARGSGTADEG